MVLLCTISDRKAGFMFNPKLIFLCLCPGSTFAGHTFDVTGLLLEVVLPLLVPFSRTLKLKDTCV